MRPTEWISGRIAWITRRWYRSVRGLGGLRGTLLAWADARAKASVRRLSVPRGPDLVVRLGRGETDMRTYLHVYADKNYEFDWGFEPRRILDVGANIGLATRWFAETHPEAAVVAIEPSPDNLHLLRHNTSHLDNVTVVEGAVSDFDGTGRLFDPHLGPWGFRVLPDGHESLRGHEPRTPCFTISSLMEHVGWEEVDIVKIDIEGGELEVFDNSHDWIHKAAGIVVELHDRFRQGATRSFVAATSEFDLEIYRGENVFVSRDSSRTSSVASRVKIQQHD